MSTIHARLMSRPVSRRLAAATTAGLLAVAAVHIVDGVGSLSDARYIGLLELALTAASATLAVMLLVRPVALLWQTTFALVGAALLCFLASRTVGLPGSTDDIGNWLQPLGLLSLAVELWVLGLALLARSRARI